MALTIDMKTPKITVKSATAVNKVQVIAPLAWLHLTQGANPPVSPKTWGAAFTIEGAVDVLVSDMNDMTGWSFAFLQFANLMASESTWGGPVESTGSIIFNTAVGPAFTTNPSLDSDSSNDPFMKMQSASQNAVAEGSGQRVSLTRDIADHPCATETLIVINGSTGFPNFLQRLRYDIGFTSVFVAKDPSGTFTPLANVLWHIVYDATFQWVSGTCTGTMVTGRADFGTPASGAPSNWTTLSAILKKPPQQNVFFNDLIATARSKGKGMTNWNETKVRDPKIPKSFFS
jgi:hypothetical protein